MLGVRSGKHPHELAVLGSFFLLGLIGLLWFDATASNTARALPFPLGHIMYGGVVLGAGIALIGVVTPGINGALIERAGLWSLALHAFAFTVGLVAINGLRGLSFGVFMGAFTAAHLVRAKQIGAEIEDMRTMMRVVLRPAEEDP